MGIAVTLMRHGETHWNTLGRWQGIAPVPLNDNGKEQTKEAAKHLINAGITHIVSSDLLRTRQTAEIVNEQLNLRLTFDPRWREIDLGRWQGLTMAEISAWDSEEFAIFDDADYIDRCFPEGESNQEHITRVTDALNALRSTYPTDAHILVVTHGGSIRSAIYPITGSAIHLSGNCSVTRLVHKGTSWDVLGIAEQPADVTW